MKYIRLYEERMKDFEIMTMKPEFLIEELKEEIQKDDYDLDYIKDLVFYGHFNLDVEWHDETYDETAFIIIATFLNKPDIVKVLLEGGANPNLKIQNFEGNSITALHLASEGGFSQVVRELLQHPDIDIEIEISHETAWDVASPKIREQFPELQPI